MHHCACCTFLPLLQLLTIITHICGHGLCLFILQTRVHKTAVCMQSTTVPNHHSLLTVAQYNQHDCTSLTCAPSVVCFVCSPALRPTETPCPTTPLWCAASVCWTWGVALAFCPCLLPGRGLTRWWLWTGLTASQGLLARCAPAATVAAVSSVLCPVVWFQ